MKQLSKGKVLFLFAHCITCANVIVAAFSPTSASQPPLCRKRFSQCSYPVRSSVRGCARLLSNDDAADLSSAGHSTYYKHLLANFQGDFDNYNQVVRDRKHGLTPGEGGGHENIHCTLVPCPQHNDTMAYDISASHRANNQWVLAAFYFNGNPRQIFRFRAYRLTSPPSEGFPVRMELNTLLPHLEKQLRLCSHRPDMWWREVWNVWCKKKNEVLRTGKIDLEEWNQLQTVGLKTMVSPLGGCDVLWDPNWDPAKHSYLYVDEYDDDCPDSGDSNVEALPPGKSQHATMEAGTKGAIVDSISMIPGKRILIKDELSIWKDEFWINDRGYDPDAVEEGQGDQEGMPFIYGNQRGIPYKLKRVTNFSRSSGDDNVEQEPPQLPAVSDLEAYPGLDRTIANSDLEWTLGEEYRTPDLFQEKMQAVGIA